MAKRREFYHKDWIMYEVVGNEMDKLSAPPKSADLHGDLKLTKPKEGDPEVEKHVPFIEEVSDGYKVSCGKNGEHAETDDHHQIFIELNVDNFTHRYYVQAGDKPSVHFKVAKGKSVYANAFCNLHGLWTYTLSK